jgi:hypothetical protein
VAIPRRVAVEEVVIKERRWPPAEVCCRCATPRACCLRRTQVPLRSMVAFKLVSFSLSRTLAHTHTQHFWAGRQHKERRNSRPVGLCRRSWSQRRSYAQRNQRRALIGPPHSLHLSVDTKRNFCRAPPHEKQGLLAQAKWPKRTAAKMGLLDGSVGHRSRGSLQPHRFSCVRISPV